MTCMITRREPDDQVSEEEGGVECTMAVCTSDLDASGAIGYT